MTFHDVTLEAGGLYSERVQDTDRIAPAAVAVFAGMIAAGGGDFVRPVPVGPAAHVRLRWTAARTAAVATFYAAGELATSSVLLSGVREADDAAAAAAFRGLVTRAFSGTPAEPGFDVLGLARRPLVASLPWPNPAVAPADLGLIADMETCLAAAWFLAVARR